MEYQVYFITSGDNKTTLESKFNEMFDLGYAVDKVVHFPYSTYEGFVVFRKMG